MRAMVHRREAGRGIAKGSGFAIVNERTDRSIEGAFYFSFCMYCIEKGDSHVHGL